MDESDPIVDDPTRPSLVALTDAGHAFSIPWNHDVRALMSGFDSSQMSSPQGPWLMPSPFETDSMKMARVLLDNNGGSTNYREGMSTSSGSSSEHLSAALGLTVGYPFLNANVTGQYDRNVLENQNGIRASRNASCRLGRVVLEQTPRLSSGASKLLHVSGPEQFRKIYGDFYVCGYELGADAGASLVADNRSSTIAETLTLTLTIKVLFFEESVSTSTTTTSATSSASMIFNGYSTLDHNSQSFTTSSLSSGDQTKLRDVASAYLRKVSSLDHRARQELKRLGLKDGKAVSLSACSRICESGLVVELLLAPFARLNDYVAL